jgi:hypothetical protein
LIDPSSNLRPKVLVMRALQSFRSIDSLAHTQRVQDDDQHCAQQRREGNKELRREATSLPQAHGSSRSFTLRMRAGVSGVPRVEKTAVKRHDLPSDYLRGESLDDEAPRRRRQMSAGRQRQQHPSDQQADWQAADIAEEQLGDRAIEERKPDRRAA